MTGVVEAVSLGLAVLPVIISVTEHFSSASRALRRYRHFSSEIGRLSTLVRIQRTIFHGEIRSLLAACVGWDQAEQLLEDTSQTRWKDKSLEESFVLQLSESHKPFLELIEWINAELSEMEVRVTTFEQMAQPPKNVDLLVGIQYNKDWIRKIRQKSRFAFAQSRLQESMNTLKELMECLRVLRSQNERSEPRRPPSRSSGQARKVIEQFALVQTASQNLDNALTLACTKHTQHQAHFSLQPIPVPRAHQVRFNVSFRQVVDPAHGSKQTMWFTVESVVKGNTETSLLEADLTSLATLARSLKRVRPSIPPLQAQPSKLKKRPMHSQLPSSPLVSSPLQPDCLGRAPDMSKDPPLLNLCSHSNFCNQLQNFFNRSVARPERCIGYLEHSSESKHLIYLKGQETQADHHLDVPSNSLAELLSQYHENCGEADGIAQCDRLQLSTKLAKAVLQFYSTPWLRNTWGSNDVLFQLQSWSNSGQTEDLRHPFVNVSIRSPVIATSNGPPAACYPFAPNDFLFGLGVMLLELAFEKPLRSMQQACDVAKSQDERHTLFFTAKRISRLVSTKLGSRYAEIVRKCLACDFGRGDDLSQPALQEGVYREVVCELTELEEHLRAMNLGP